MTEDVIRCKFCDGEITATAQKCKHCGEWLIEKRLEQKQPEQIQVVINNQRKELSSKSRFIALILLFFGFHRFYVGKAFSGLLFLFTAGGAGVWWVLDFLSLTTGNFKDDCNLPLR